MLFSTFLKTFLMGSECRLKFLKNMFFNLMILGNGIIPRYHQSGFIRREEDTSGGEKRKKSNLRRGSFCPAYKVQIITGDILDGFLQDSEDQYGSTKPPGTTQCRAVSVMTVMILLIMIMIRIIIREDTGRESKGKLIVVVSNRFLF